MKLLLVGIFALANRVSAIATGGNDITSICSVASYDNGVAHTILTRPYSLATSYGSVASSTLARAISDSYPYQAQYVAQYAAVLRAFVAPLGGVGALTNADAAEIIDINAQIVNFLNILVQNTLRVVNPALMSSYLYNIKISMILEHSALNSLISASGGVSCDKQNSLNSLGSQLNSLYSVLGKIPMYAAFLAYTTTITPVASVNCPLECTTITLSGTSSSEITTSETSTISETSAASTTTSSTDASTSSTDTSTLSTASTTATSTTTTSIDETSTASSSTITSSDASSTSDTSTATASSSTQEVISSRTVSGSIQRCLVRPTTSARVIVK